MGRKPRSDAKLHNLPLEQQQELCDLMLGGISYQNAKAFVLSAFKVSTSVGALHDFFHSFCVPELARQRVTARDTAGEVATEAKESPGQWSEAALEKLEQYAFELMIMPGADPKHVKSIFSMVFKRGDAERADAKIELDRDRLALAKEKQALDREKFEELKRKAQAADDAAGVVGDGELTPEEKQARLKQIFGMG